MQLIKKRLLSIITLFWLVNSDFMRNFLFHSWRLHPEDGGRKFVRRPGNYLSVNTVSYFKSLNLKFFKQLWSYLNLSVWMPAHAIIIIHNYLHSSYIIPFTTLSLILSALFIHLNTTLHLFPCVVTIFDVISQRHRVFLKTPTI